MNVEHAIGLLRSIAAGTRLAEKELKAGDSTGCWATMDLIARDMDNLMTELGVRESAASDPDGEVVVPCVDGTENHLWVVSDENENDCYCERCGCREY